MRDEAKPETANLDPTFILATRAFLRDREEEIRRREERDRKDRRAILLGCSIGFLSEVDTTSIPITSTVEHKVAVRERTRSRINGLVVHNPQIPDIDILKQGHDMLIEEYEQAVLADSGLEIELEVARMVTSAIKTAPEVDDAFAHQVLLAAKL